MAEFNITITHTTSGKEIVVAVEPSFTISSILDVLSDSLKLKDRFVLSTPDHRILGPDVTVQEASLKENDRLLLMPDPTGGAK